MPNNMAFRFPYNLRVLTLRQISLCEIAEPLWFLCTMALALPNSQSLHSPTLMTTELATTYLRAT